MSRLSKLEFEDATAKDKIIGSDPFNRIEELEGEISYLKKMLNLKRGRGGVNELLLKLQELEKENIYLKKKIKTKPMIIQKNKETTKKVSADTYKRDFPILINKSKNSIHSQVFSSVTNSPSIQSRLEVSGLRSHRQTASLKLSYKSHPRLPSITNVRKRDRFLDQPIADSSFLKQKLQLLERAKQINRYRSQLIK